MPFGYLEFSRAIGREPCPIMRARAAAGGGGGGRPVPVPGSLPGLVLFESGLKGMGRYPNQTRSAVRFRTDLPTGVRPVGRPMVANLLDCQRLQPFVWVRTCWPLLECYIKHSNLSIEKHTTNTPRANNSLSLSLSLYLSSEAEASLRSELGSRVLK